MQMTHGNVLQYKVAPSIEMPNFAAWVIAFCSAWVPRQSSAFLPEGTLSFSRMHPTSAQCGTPRGAPLYPAVSCCLSFAITAPTFRLQQVARFAHVYETSMKTSSNVGRSAPVVDFTKWSSFLSSSSSDPSFMIKNSETSRHFWTCWPVSSSPTPLSFLRRSKTSSFVMFSSPGRFRLRILSVIVGRLAVTARSFEFGILLISVASLGFRTPSMIHFPVPKRAPSSPSIFSRTRRPKTPGPCVFRSSLPMSWRLPLLCSTPRLSASSRIMSEREMYL